MYSHVIITIILRIIGDLPNTYAFTKSLAEDAIRREAQDLPILVFRPTVGMCVQLVWCTYIIYHRSINIRLNH